MVNAYEFNDNSDMIEPELSCLINLKKIKSDHVKRQIRATVEECIKLAKRFELIELKSFIANLKVTKLNSHASFLVEGKFEAKVVQQCVVTLEPVFNDISGSLSCRYSESLEKVNLGSVDFDSLTEDPPELIIDGEFDIGILLTEHLGLELDPFPRLVDACFDSEYGSNGTDNTRQTSSNPFNILKKLK